MDKAPAEAALKYNQSIWTIFRRSWKNPKTPAHPLKVDLLRLSAFIDSVRLRQWPIRRRKINYLIKSTQHRRRAAHFDRGAGKRISRCLDCPAWNLLF